MSNGCIVHDKDQVIVIVIVVVCGEERDNHNCGKNHHTKSIHQMMNV